MARIRQSRPDSGLSLSLFQAKYFELCPSRSTAEGGAGPRQSVADRYRAYMKHPKESRPDSGLDLSYFLVKSVAIFPVVRFSLGRSRCGGPSLSLSPSVCLCLCHSVCLLACPSVWSGTEGADARHSVAEPVKVPTCKLGLWVLGFGFRV